MIICTLKQVLRRKGWTRYRLQKKSGVTYPTLHALYHNKSKLYSAGVLNKLCYTLHCEPGDLIQWRPDRFPRLKRKSQ